MHSVNQNFHKFRSHLCLQLIHLCIFQHISHKPSLKAVYCVKRPILSLHIYFPGDPRRPYPLDIEMRSGLLGRLGESPAVDSSLPTPMSNLQETGHIPAPNGVGEL